MGTVTKRQAERVLNEVRKMYPQDAAEFTLYPASHEGLPKGCWSIAAEIGNEWTFDVSEAEFEGLIDLGNVFIEPIASWCLGIYPMGD